MIRETYDVSGMSCSACSARVERAVGKILGAENVSVNLLTNSMQLSRPENISVEEIIATVEKSGYGAKLKSKKSPRQNISEEIREMKIRLGGSIAFLILQMTLGMSNPTLEILCAIPIAILNRKFFIAGFRNLFQLAPNMDSLIALGSTADNWTRFSCGVDDFDTDNARKISRISRQRKNFRGSEKIDQSRSAKSYIINRWNRKTNSNRRSQNRRRNHCQAWRANSSRWQNFIRRNNNR